MSSTAPEPAATPNGSRTPKKLRRMSRSRSSSRTRAPRPPANDRQRSLVLVLRFLVSSPEYGAIRKHIFRKIPAIKNAMPSHSQFHNVLVDADPDDYLPSATRAGLRAMVTMNVTLNLYQLLVQKLKSRGAIGAKRSTPVKNAFFSRPNFMASLSLGVLIIIHRVLYRFLHQLRTNLMLPEAKDFRTKYPRAAKVFLSPYSPSITASLAGFALLLHPKTDLRQTIAVYTLVKAAEYWYNRFEDKGYFVDKPWWFGSWLLFPITSGQLFYSFVFDRDCFPTEFAPLYTRFTPEYIQPRPVDYPSNLPWPAPLEIVDSLGKIADLKFPSFSSPILYPDVNKLPSAVAAISPIVSPAHPTIKSLQCALMHPSEPSCLKTYIHYWATEAPRIGKLLLAIYTLIRIPRIRSQLQSPLKSLATLGESTTRTTLLLTGALGTPFALLCLFSTLLPHRLLPRSRFFLAGGISGLFAFLDRHNSRGNFLYSFRVFLVSAWKLAVKKNLVKPVKNGDVWVFVIALAAINAAYEREMESVSGGGMRKVLSSLRGLGWRDLVKERREREERVKEAVERNAEKKRMADGGEEAEKEVEKEEDKKED
ncbi:hypothetical protein EX30DRAFT_325142 [Ascodesmis nigricans]|uniref:Transmembrane protein 135 N-terminal domain-containing protein n=1 Tax=Ascodesmis nigricans TaxID=341454 RepID=A0A4S2N5X7_9PEZI|nr:hypothetical protein EX30DRAFT_325142 [Ascodesmis nigricans]